jgi:hypothetical protein
VSTEITRRSFLRSVSAATVFSAVGGKILAKELFSDSSGEIEMYDVGGQVVFPEYVEYGFTARLYAYPFLKMGRCTFVYGYRTDLANLLENDKKPTDEMWIVDQAKKEFMSAWKTAPREVKVSSFDGAQMPYPGAIYECEIKSNGN